MLEKALEATWVECEPNTARNAVALLAGPEKQLTRVVKNNRERGRFEDEIRGCLGNYGPASGSARFFMANFPQMTDVRLTVLLRRPPLSAYRAGNTSGAE